VRQDEQGAMRDYQRSTHCRMRFLREQLDDPQATDCGRCDNCGGLTVPSEIGAAALAHAAAVLERPGVPVPARRQWPTAMPGLGIDVRGKLPAADQAETGRVIARFTDPGFGHRLRSVLAADAPDIAVPDDLVGACVKVLAAWDWEQRPAAVVHVGSVRRPALVSSLAARLAEVGRLADLGGVVHLGNSAGGRTNSALRLREVWTGYDVPADLASQLRGQPLLLVDDLVDTGWTLTVVARLLRRAGAGRIYPFALALAA
jgi:ATP-dependent DNA helicase RecQ